MTPPEQAIAARLTAIAERNTPRTNLLLAIKSLAAKAEQSRHFSPADCRLAQLEAISTFERVIIMDNYEHLREQYDRLKADELDRATADLRAHVETLTQQVAEWQEDAREFQQDAEEAIAAKVQAEQQRDAAHAALKKQERINEMLHERLNRNVPCSDHRDKISPGVCPICEAEQRTVARLKANAALAASAPQKE